MSATEQWANFLHVLDKHDLRDNLSSWQAYAEQLEERIKRANAIIHECNDSIKELSITNAGNLAEKIVLRKELLKYAGAYSPLVADMMPNATSEDKAKAEWMRNEIKTRAAKALERTNSFEAVRQAAEDIKV